MAISMADLMLLDEDDDFLFDPNPRPYLFEPEYTEEELRAMEEQEQATSTSQDADVRERAHTNWWCKCGVCEPMPTETESLCCLEWDKVLPSMARETVSEPNEEEPARCVTSTEDFSVMIHPTLIDFFFRCDKVNWKKRPTPEGPNGQLSTK